LIKKLETKDSDNIWRTFAKLRGKDVKQCNEIPYLKVKEELISDSEEKAKLFSEAFILSDTSNDADRQKLLNDIRDKKSPGLTIPSVTAEEINQVGYKLKNKYSSSDVIPINILKPLLPSILLPLSLLFSTIIHTGDYPIKFKEAIVTPFYKGKGSLTDANNYRPISGLNSISKLFEYVLRVRIMSHVE